MTASESVFLARHATDEANMKLNSLLQAKYASTVCGLTCDLIVLKTFTTERERERERANIQTCTARTLACTRSLSMALTPVAYTINM